MARIRTIKPEFFRHEELYEAERTSGLPLRLAFAGLWTAADREGRFKWQPRALKLDCLPYDDVDFGAILSALQRGGFIVQYQVDETDSLYGYIPGWNAHQHINQREAQSTLPDPAGARTCTHIPARGEGKGREGKGNDIRAVAEATRPDAERPFDEFWKAYPSRGDAANPKKPAKDRFLKACKSGADPAEIIAAAKRYAAIELGAGRIRTDKVAQAVTWLNQCRWQDYAQNAPADSPAPGYYATAMSMEIEAWDAYRKKTEGKAYPRDSKGGWQFPSQWPPDVQEHAA